jgi:hypothetical protein
MMTRRAKGEETLAEIARFYNVNFREQPLHSLDGISLTRSFVSQWPGSASHGSLGGGRSSA